MEFTSNQIGKLPGLDDIILDSSKLQRVRLKNPEGIKTSVIIGEKNEYVKHPLPLDVPFFLSGGEADGRTLLDFYNQGAVVLGSREIVSHPGSTKSSARRILNFDSGRAGISVKHLSEADAVNIDVGEGLNPALAGGTSVANHLSPHLDMHSPEDLGRLIDLIRETTAYSIPVMVSASGYDVYELTKFAVEGGADAVNLITEVPLASLPPAVDAFSDTDARKQDCKLLLTTPLRSAEDAMKLFALGADAIGLRLAGTIPFASQPLIYESSMKELVDDLKYWLTLTGFVDCSHVNDECIRAVDYNTAAVAGIKLIGYDRKLPMWEHA